jgi:hypothetical protein
MPAIETPQTAAASSTEQSDTVNNPVQTQTDSIVTLILKLEGVNLTPANIYSMLDTQFGTVAAEKGAGGNTRGCYIYKITP